MSQVTVGEKLSKKTKFLYGIGDVGNALINSAVQFFLLKFFTDGALILPALAGNALLIGKFWDAINDPLFGWITDRTNSPLGRRRVYMLFGAIPLAISVALLWFVPEGMSQLWTFVWIAGTFIFFDTMWTLTNVPYYALTSELTDDYDERSALTAYRMGLAVPAYLVGAALTPMIVGFFAVQRTGWGFIGIIYGAICALVLLIAASGIRERKKVSDVKSETPPLKAFVATFKNKPFVRLCLTYLIVNLSFALIKTLMAYYLEYQLSMKDEVSLVMGLMLVTVTVSLLFWKKIGEKLDKGPAYAMGMAIGAVGVAITFFLPHEPTWVIYLIAVMAGFGFGANWIFPWAMVADIADYDRLNTGEFRSGMYYGVWGLATKFSEALAIAMVGWILTGFGYVANVEQTVTSLLGIRLFFGPIPAVVILAALPLLIWYPITRKSHAKVRAELDARDQKPQS
ncbi:MAG TPA: MFS transporter [Longilinea sp.]|nr:MFS transporter [Longilinea sp.]